MPTNTEGVIVYMDCGKVLWVLKLIFAMHVVNVFISMKYMQALFYIYTYTHLCMYIYVCVCMYFVLFFVVRRGFYIFFSLAYSCQFGF